MWKDWETPTSKEIISPERADRECDGRTALKETCKNGWRWRTTYRRSWRLVTETVARER